MSLNLMTSCDFAPDTEVFSDLKEPDLSTISLTINNSSDTLSLFQNKEIRFTLNGPGILQARTAVLIDSDTVFSSISRTDLFTINTNQLGTGKHTLRIQSFFSKKTNSVAGTFGLEVYTISRNWIILVDIDPPTPIQIIGIEKINGKPKITWQKYSRINFQNYQLIKRCYDSPTSTSFITCGYVLILDKNATYYHDTAYTSGKVEYLILVSGSNQLASSDPYSYIE
jgi:hypothetical protein